MFLFWQYYHKIQFTREPGAEALRCVYTCGVCLAYACWLGWCTQMKVYMEVELWWFSLHIIPTFFFFVFFTLLCLVVVRFFCEWFFADSIFLYACIHIVYSFMHYASQYRTNFRRRMHFFLLKILILWEMLKKKNKLSFALFFILSL